MLTHRFINESAGEDSVSYDLIIEEDGAQVARSTINFDRDGMEEVKAAYAQAMIQQTQVERASRFGAIRAQFMQQVNLVAEELLDKLEKKNLAALFAALPNGEAEARIRDSMTEVLVALHTAGEGVLGRLPDKPVTE